MTKKILSALKIDQRFLYVYTLLLIGSIIAINITNTSQDFVNRSSSVGYFLALGVLLMSIKAINLTFANFLHALKSNSPAVFLVNTILLCIQLFLTQNSIVPLTQIPYSDQTYLYIALSAIFFFIQTIAGRTRSLITWSAIVSLVYGGIYGLLYYRFNITSLLLQDTYAFVFMIVEGILVYISYRLVFDEFELNAES